MKRKKIQSIKQICSISSRHKAIAIWIFTLLLVSAFFLPSNAISKTQARITWEPNVLYNAIGNGQVAQDLYVKFVSTENLTDVSVWAVPELQPFIIVSPEIFLICLEIHRIDNIRYRGYSFFFRIDDCCF